jgi:hypothetical protein
MARTWLLSAGQLGASAPLDKQWHEISYRALFKPRVGLLDGRQDSIRRNLCIRAGEPPF